MRDWRGSIIEVGSVVVYPQRHSSSMWMVEGIVREVTEKRKYDRTIPILKVEPVASTWTHDEITKKVVTLTVLDRVTVVFPRKNDTHAPDGYCSICHDFHTTIACTS